MSKYSPVADNVEDALQPDGVSERKLAYHGDGSNAALGVAVATTGSNRMNLRSRSMSALRKCCLEGIGPQR
jgi:hypothetical protein